MTGLKIMRATNGWVLVYEDEVRVVASDAQESAATAQALLWEVIEMLDLAGSRYDAQRVRVVMEPGDKYIASYETVADPPPKEDGL